MFGILIGVIGGLSLFLYGMKMMSDGLEVIAGSKLKPILKKLTSNKYVAVVVGMIVTALVQSSSATTVMLVSFVNSGIMSLEQTVYIIMGANIGTTFTTQLIALDFSKFAAIISMVGVIMIIFVKNKKSNNLGLFIAGMGILFLGMGIMSSSVEPLKAMPEFTNFMTKFSNPLLGVLVGIGVTAIIQSSAASLGILQALSVTGAITLQNSFYLMLGADIGTCVTGVLASLGTNKDAKRTAMIHLLFNVIGMLVFLLIIQFVPFIPWVASLSSSVKTQIANANSIYKIVVTLILFPFGNKLAWLARKLIPDSKDMGVDDKEKAPILDTKYLSNGQIGTGAVAVTEMKREINYMMDLVQQNLDIGMNALINYNDNGKNKLYKNEEALNKANLEMSRYMNQVTTLDLTPNDSALCISLFKMSTDLERMGDHAKNLIEYLGWHAKLNPEAVDELKTLKRMMDEGFHHFRHNDLSVDLDAVGALENIEDSVDMLTAQYRNDQLVRLQEKKCSTNNAVEYSNVLIDVERVFDHMTNVLGECRAHHFSLFESSVETKEAIA